MSKTDPRQLCAQIRSRVLLLARRPVWLRGRQGHLLRRHGEPELPMLKVRLFAVALFLAMAACSDDDVESDLIDTRAELEQAQEQVAALESQLSEVRGHVDSLTTASAELDAAVGRLQYEDWGDVVPIVARSTSEISSVAADLDHASAER